MNEKCSLVRKHTLIFCDQHLPNSSADFILTKLKMHQNYNKTNS